MSVYLAELIAEHGIAEKYMRNYLCPVVELIFELTPVSGVYLVEVFYVYLDKKELDTELSMEFDFADEANSYLSALTSYFNGVIKTNIA